MSLKGCPWQPMAYRVSQWVSMTQNGQTYISITHPSACGYHPFSREQETLCLSTDLGHKKRWLTKVYHQPWLLPNPESWSWKPDSHLQSSRDLTLSVMAHSTWVMQPAYLKKSLVKPTVIRNSSMVAMALLCTWSPFHMHKGSIHAVDRLHYFLWTYCMA